jgi:hypothetical protein
MFGQGRETVKTVFRFGIVGAACLLLCAGASAKEEDPAREAKIAAMQAAREEALAVLKRTSDFLGQQTSFSFTADTGYEVLQLSGVKVEFGAHREATVRRPDHAHVDIVRRDGEHKIIRYDGQIFTAFFPDENAYASLERPGTLDQLIDYLEDDVGVPMPLSDFLHSDFYADVHDRIELGAVVGEATIDGRLCEHLVLVSGEADFQIWIEKGETPLPRRLVITYREAPGIPQFWARIHDWNLAAESSDALFAFSPPEGAERLLVRTTAAEGGE